jgi:hypothetical protein
MFILTEMPEMLIQTIIDFFSGPVDKLCNETVFWSENVTPTEQGLCIAKAWAQDLEQVRPLKHQTSLPLKLHMTDFI